MQATRKTGLRILWLVAGFTVWAAAFVTLYSMLSVGCRFGWDGMFLPGGISLQRTVLVGLFVLCLVANALVLLLAFRGRRKLERGPAAQSFLLQGGELAAIAALVATAVSLGPVFFLSPCI